MYAQQTKSVYESIGCETIFILYCVFDRKGMEATLGCFELKKCYLSHIHFDARYRFLFLYQFVCRDVCVV